VEHMKGRRLFIVTTNLDTQRTVIWDMGRIASLRSPQAVSLFRDVLAASASIPVVFPPILIDAEANGNRFQEMHVDGGVTAPVLTLPEAFLLRYATLPNGPQTKIYILMNNKVERDFQVVPNSTVDIAARASSSATKTQTRSLLYETYEFAQRNKFGFNLSYIGKDVPSSKSPGFETKYMRGLYQYGYERARAGDFWAKAPPYDEFSQNGGRRQRPVVLNGRGIDRHRTRNRVMNSVTSPSFLVPTAAPSRRPSSLALLTTLRPNAIAAGTGRQMSRQ